MVLSKEELKRIRSYSDYFEERRLRARERLTKITRSYWYFAIVGFNSDLKRFEFGLIGHIQQVREPADLECRPSERGREIHPGTAH